MTIHIKIQNLESRDDRTKELIVQTLREDDSVQTMQAIPGGGEASFYVHKHQHLKIIERFEDQQA